MHRWFAPIPVACSELVTIHRPELSKYAHDVLTVTA